MNTLLSNSVFSTLEKWSTLKNIIAEIQSKSQNFPVEIEGLQGAMHSFFTAEYLQAKQARLFNGIQYMATGRYSQPNKPQNNIIMSTSLDIMIIVPTEKDAEDVCTDLKSAFS